MKAEPGVEILVLGYLLLAGIAFAVLRRRRDSSTWYNRVLTVARLIDQRL